jgi:L-threonylcarbamoyladenylate synthase
MIVAATAKNILAAANLLRQGRLVAFPTETVYGLGANAFEQTAVAKIFEAKNRPAINPLIVHISNIDELTRVTSIPTGSLCAQRVGRLSSFWPGPLSLVLPKHPQIPGNVTANLDTVAVRIPSHPIALSLLKEAGVPVAAPSANQSTKVSPTCAQHVEQDLGSTVDLIIDGGNCLVGIESTVLAVHQEYPVILRPGAITQKQLEERLKERVYFYQDFKSTSDNQVTTPSSPGLLFRHYAPMTKLVLKNMIVPEQLRGEIGLISFKPTTSTPYGSYSKVICLSKVGSLQEVAQGLFAAIHKLDQLDLDLIVVDVCEEEGLGVAIMDRLKKACGCN